ncbi:MAG TPA: pyruvate ferredoxin oxidoreductase [Lentisphaeria bacterium]|nr:MAG: pyruvate ferredoxin oxidoreductase [Lentisphaerae bacterium GWF2_50_93]HCE42408.1 pyruvate ferredoxin oxidoreductase [Lentisphaeria bacterium]
MNDTINIIIAGIGGQGVIKASDILSEAAFEAGYDVKKSEIHGMSQRGGSVTSDVRFGKKVFSPTIQPGEADFLLVLAADQVDNNLFLLKKSGCLITPEKLKDVKLSEPKSINTALLGVLSSKIEIPENFWEAAIMKLLPGKLSQTNIDAFKLGRNTK